MKNISFLLFVFCQTITIATIQAQVGIGTVTPQGALDITSTTDGLLIPRVALSATNTSTITTPTISELVYNTFTSAAGPNQVVPGYYYWNGTIWVQLVTGSSNWSVTGNSGTTAGTNFIGTTDAVDFRIKTNGTDRWNISNANSGQLQSYSLGTAALPAYSFQGDPNTGILSPGADQLGFATNGVARFRIPAADQVHALSLGTAALPFYSFSADTNTGLFSPTADNIGLSTAGVERLRALANGHVLVNTTTNDATSGSDNVFEALATTAGDDAISGYANGAGGTGVAGYSTLTGIGVSGTNSSNGYGVYGTTTGSSNEDISGTVGLSFYGAAASGYSSPLADASPSAIGGVTGVVASQETNTNDEDYYFGIIGEVLVANSATNYVPQRSGGVLGSSGSGTWAALGYKTSAGLQASIYGSAIFTTNFGGGKSINSQPNNAIGLGINGGFMGGYVKGNQFGLISKGDDFGMYVAGKTITNEPIVQLFENTNGNSRIAAYSPASTTIDVTTRGKGKLIKGEVFVAFDKNFIEMAGLNNDAINITITPTDETKGVYVSKITPLGFYVKENMEGKSNSSFYWNAIGTRKGFEKGVEISKVILSNDFDKNMDGVMHNENDRSKEATPVYFDGTSVKFESMPSQYERKASVLSQPAEPKKP